MSLSIIVIFITTFILLLDELIEIRKAKMTSA
jgi:hypothetical protein